MLRSPKRCTPVCGSRPIKHSVLIYRIARLLCASSGGGHTPCASPCLPPLRFLLMLPFAAVAQMPGTYSGVQANGAPISLTVTVNNGKTYLSGFGVGVSTICPDGEAINENVGIGFQPERLNGPHFVFTLLANPELFVDAPITFHDEKKTVSGTVTTYVPALDHLHRPAEKIGDLQECAALHGHARRPSDDRARPAQACHLLAAPPEGASWLFKGWGRPAVPRKAALCPRVRHRTGTMARFSLQIGRRVRGNCCSPCVRISRFKCRFKKGNTTSQYRTGSSWIELLQVTTSGCTMPKHHSLRQRSCSTEHPNQR